MTEIIINNLEGIRESARQFISKMGEGSVFAFYGGMGAGKTTFVKAICEELGVEDVVIETIRFSPSGRLLCWFKSFTIQTDTMRVSISMYAGGWETIRFFYVSFRGGNDH